MGRGCIRDGAKPPFRPAPASRPMHSTRTLVDLVLEKMCRKMGFHGRRKKGSPRVPLLGIVTLVLRGQWVWVTSRSLWTH